LADLENFKGKSMELLGIEHREEPVYSTQTLQMGTGID
jgi:hypothetical protein